MVQINLQYSIDICVWVIPSEPDNGHHITDSDVDGNLTDCQVYWKNSRAN